MEYSSHTVEKIKKTDTKENGKKVSQKVKGFIIGLVDQNIKENRKEAVEMGMEFTTILMEKDMKDNIKKIKKMEKELIIGQTTIGKKDSIRMEGVMVGQSTTMQMEE